MKYSRIILTISLGVVLNSAFLTSVSAQTQGTSLPNTGSVDAQIAQIEAETMKSLDSQLGSTNFGEIRQKAEQKSQTALNADDCQNIMLMASECHNDKSCLGVIWDNTKSCIIRFPMTGISGSITDWLKDRLRLARMSVERNDRAIAQYENETAKAEALLAQANAESADIQADLEKIGLDETNLDNQVSMDEINSLRQELQAKEEIIAKAATPAAVAVATTTATTVATTATPDKSSSPTTPAAPTQAAAK